MNRTNPGDRPDITIRRVVLAIIAGCASAWFFATAVFIDFDAIRIRPVREPSSVQQGVARVRIRDERTSHLRPPFALIARIRNGGEEPLRFSIRLNDRPVCDVEVPAGSARRIDCEVGEWDRRPEDELAIEPESPHPWAIEYLEIATHHGRSSGLLEALVLPRGGSHLFTAPSWPWAAVAGAGLAALLLLPSRRFVPQWLRVGHVVASIVAIVPFAAAAIGPLVSPYRVVLSPWTFASWLSIPLLPRLWWGARSVWPAIPIRIRTAIFTTSHLVFRSHRRLAWALAIALVTVAVAYGGRVVGGADEYGYLSQADLWLSGRLIVDQPFLRNTPWPDSMPWWFSPFGYRPEPTNTGAIVPTYSPGLPLMLAAAKLVGGHDAVFLVVPMCAGLLVLATYALGRHLGSGIAPLVAAWLVATSPLVLSHAMVTMSDVPVAAAWTGAFCLLLGTSTASAAGAGVLAGLAVLIRPNLAPLALVLGSLYVIRMRTSGVRALVHLAVFGMAAAPAAVAIAVINDHLYGSPLTSGYGPVAELFETARMLPNLRNYVLGLIESHTPMVLVGVAAMAFPARWLWPAVRERSVFIIIAAFVVALWAIYCAWVVFDSWWYGRFLLSSFPFIMLGVGACADALFRLRARWIHVSVVVAVVALGLAQLHFASTHTVFLVGRGMWRYAVAADLTRRVSGPNSVVIALNHGGTVRYYGSRMTINIGTMADGGPVDELVDWLQQRGVRTYATFEDWEIEEVSRRFADTVFASTLNGRPLAVFNDPGRVLVYELSHAHGVPPEPLIVNGFGNRRRAVPPGAPPRLLIGPPRRD